MKRNKVKNEILEEIWQARKEIEDQEGGDIKRVFEKMQKKTSQSKREQYSGKTKSIEKSKINMQ